MRKVHILSPFIHKTQVRLKNLDELDAGQFEGLTYDEIAEKYPEEFRARTADKLVKKKILLFQFSPL